MSTRKVPKIIRPTVDAIVEEWNALVTALGEAGVILHFEEESTPIETIDATDLTTGVVLANLLKTAYVAHIASTKKHGVADSTNEIAADDATDQATLNTLLNELQPDLTAHQVLAASHRAAGATVAKFNALINALGLTGHVLHLQEAVSGEPISAADATDLATAVVLANAARTAYGTHIASVVKHPAADSTNTISAPASTDQATLNTLLNELRSDLNAHTVLEASHRGVDTEPARINALIDGLGQTGLLLHLQEALPADIITTIDSTDASTVLALVNELRALYVAHIASVTKHPAADGTNTVGAPAATDATTVITLADELKVDLNAHQILAASHRGIGGQGSQAPPTVISTANATDEATSIVLVNAEKATWNLHVRSGATSAAGSIASAAADSEATSVVLANEVKDVYNLHLRSGAAVDPASAGTASATDLATSLVSVNVVKDAYNAHATSGAQNLNVAGT